MIIRIVLIGFTAFLAWLIHVANTGGHNILLDFANDIPNGDKIGHFFLMGILAYLVNLLLECKSFKIGGLSLLKGSIIVGFCVIVEEFTQQFIPTRTFSYLDLLSDFLGILVFSLIAVKTYPFITRLLKKRGQDRTSGYKPIV